MPNCSVCGGAVDVFKRKRDGAILHLEPGTAVYTRHVCPLEELPVTVLCTCDLVVVVYADGTRRLWPSGELHTTHAKRPSAFSAELAEEGRRFSKWHQREARRAQAPEPRKQTRIPERPKAAPERSQERERRPEPPRPTNRPIPAPTRRESAPTKPQQPIRRTLDV